METQRTVIFDDAETNEQAALVVAPALSSVELTLSLERSGEASARIPIDVAIRLRAALDAAIATVQHNRSDT
jgi:hypothetical protein